MAEITIKLTEKMVFDRQHCYEDSDCSECSCCMANDECLFSFREERKVGKWIEFPVNRFSRCSNCGFESAWDYTSVKNWNYCPNCGASFKEEKRGNEDGSN